MKTVFVNPSRKRRRRSRRRNVNINPRARHTRRRRSVRRVTRRRRRNAGVASFIQKQNPMILQNPRRRRRRNPSFSFKGMNLSKMFNKVLTLGGGAAVGAGANILVLRKIDNDWVRNGARVAVALVGCAFLPGEMGAAMAGATLYPAFAELALMTNLVSGAGASPTGDDEETEADLSELAADLQDVLDDVEEDQVSDVLFD